MVYFRRPEHLGLAGILKNPPDKKLAGGLLDTETNKAEADKGRANAGPFYAYWYGVGEEWWEDEEQRHSHLGGPDKSTSAMFSVTVYGNLPTEELYEILEGNEGESRSGGKGPEGENYAAIFNRALDALLPAKTERSGYCWLDLAKTVNLVLSRMKFPDHRDRHNPEGDGFAVAVSCPRYMEAMAVYSHHANIYYLLGGEEPDAFGCTNNDRGLAVSDANGVATLNANPHFQAYGKQSAEPLENGFIHVVGLVEPLHSDYTNNSFAIDSPIFDDPEFGILRRLHSDLGGVRRSVESFADQVRAEDLDEDGSGRRIGAAVLERAAKDLAAYDEAARSIRDDVEAENASNTTKDNIRWLLKRAENYSARLKERLPPAAPKGWTQEVAMRIMREGADWQSGFEPTGLVERFADKVHAKRNQQPEFWFADSGGAKKVFTGFQKHVNGLVLEAAKANGYGEGIPKTVEGFMRTLSNDALRTERNGGTMRWDRYNAALVDLHAEVLTAYRDQNPDD